ncbi:hypothetical protein, partial [Mesoflavibacter sp. CH_XMU1422-2]|uniref:hypothetical protein n=1 Tax=Mesoflavibacter sp. CH_XMU1422-2 TaxID=3107770 RepID=UPI00300AC9E4
LRILSPGFKSEYLNFFLLNIFFQDYLQRVGIRIVAVLCAADFPIGKSDAAKAQQPLVKH